MQFRLSTLFGAVLICGLAISFWQIFPVGVVLFIWATMTSAGVHWSDRHAASKCKSPWSRLVLDFGAGAFWGVGAAFAILVGAIVLSLLIWGFDDTADVDEQYFTPGEAFVIGATFCTVVGGICGCALGGVQGLVYCVQSVPMTEAPAEKENGEETHSE